MQVESVEQSVDIDWDLGVVPGRASPSKDSKPNRTEPVHQMAGDLAVLDALSTTQFKVHRPENTIILRNGLLEQTESAPMGGVLLVQNIMDETQRSVHQEPIRVRLDQAYLKMVGHFS